MIRNLIVYGVLLLLPIAVAAPYISRGVLPLDLRLPATQPPWMGEWPEAAEARRLPDAAIRHGMQTYPWYHYMHEAGQEGFLPLWNDDEGTGYPFLAAWRTRALSPFSLPIYFLPMEQALWVSMLLKLVIAGWTMQFFARRLGLTPSTAACAAVAYQWSGGVYGAFDMAIADVLAWLPLLLLGLDGVATSRPRAWAVAALALGLMLLGGAPELTLPLFVSGILYIALRGLATAKPGERIRVLRGAGLWLLLGGGFAAVQWWPYVEFLRHGFFAGRVERVPEWPGLRRMLMLGVVPERDSVVARLFHPGYVQWLLLPLWLAVRSFSTAEARRSIEAFLVVAVVMAGLDGLLLANPAWTAALGGFAPRFAAFLIAPACALAAGKAIAVWIRLNPDQAKIAAKWLLFLIPVFWGVVLVPVAIRDIDDLTIVGAIAGIVFILLVVTLLKPRRAIFSASVAVLTFALLLLGNRPDFNFTPRDKAFPETEFIQSLREIDGRIAGSGALRGWPLSGNGVAQVFPTSGVRLKNFDDFLTRLDGEPRLLRQAGGRHLLFTREDIQGEYAELRPRLGIDTVFSSGAVLFEDLRAEGEARLLAPEDGTAETLFGASLVELRRGTDPNRITVGLRSSGEATLVVADVYYPGWTAEAGGERLPVAAYEGLFRSVVVDERHDEVGFVYRPDSVRSGLVASACALLGIVLGLLWPRRQEPSEFWHTEA